MKRGRATGRYLLTASVLCVVLAGCKKNSGEGSVQVWHVEVCDQCVGHEQVLPDGSAPAFVTAGRNSVTIGEDTLHGLEIDGELCHSSKAKPGEVETEPIIQELGWIDQAKGEVGMEERPQTGTLLAKFMCGENTVEVRGARVGILTPVNRKVTSAEHFLLDAALNESEGMLYPNLEGRPAVTYEIQVNGGGFTPAALGGTAELVPSATAEVSTASGEPLIVTPQEIKRREKEEAKKKKEEEKQKKKEEKQGGK